MAKMTAADVREALDACWRWPAREYVIVDEAPDDASRQGRKLDRLVISCWRSRGLELDGIEIKVTMSDFRKELKDPAKADWWWHRVHRFWIACPADLADKVKAELPTGWGLLVVTDEQTRVAVKPEKNRNPKSLPWTAVVGLLRTATGAGFGALMREYDRGRAAGFKEGERSVERKSGDERLRNEIKSLRARIAAFEEATGLNFDHVHSEDGAERLGEMVTLIQRAFADPETIRRNLDVTADNLERNAVRVRKLAAVLNGDNSNEDGRD